MSKNKAKGTTYENKVRDALINNDIPSVRSPQLTHGRSKKEFDTDVLIGTLDHPIASIECKFRGSVPLAPYKWLGSNDYLVMKRIGKQYKDLVVMDLDHFIKLYKGEHNE